MNHEKTETPRTIETPDGTAQAIPAFPGYFVTVDGKVWSTLRAVPIRMKTHRDQQSNLALGLSVNGHRTVRTVQRLMMEAYVGPRPVGHVASHRNGDPKDNQLGNLVWRLRQQRHDFAAHGEDSSRAKLTEAQAKGILDDSETSHADLARRYQVTDKEIFNIRHRRKWKHIEHDETKPVYKPVRRKLAELEAWKIRFKENDLIKNIAMKYGCDQSNVSRIRNGHTWKHLRRDERPSA